MWKKKNFYIRNNLLLVYYVPKDSVLADRSIIHGKRSQWRISTSEKYNTKQTGQRRAAFNKPMSEKNRETWPYVASPIIFLNITWKLNIYYLYFFFITRSPISIICKYFKIVRNKIDIMLNVFLTLYTADPAAAKAASKTPVIVFFLFVTPASMYASKATPVLHKMTATIYLKIIMIRHHARIICIYIYLSSCYLKYYTVIIIR